jgi:hypothetical protein
MELLAPGDDRRVLLVDELVYLISVDEDTVATLGQDIREALVCVTLVVNPITGVGKVSSRNHWIIPYIYL